ncbi:Uncharacterised protein [Pasteurella canis]|nr:Uncharacterised protein [Pasteurella canis]
MITHTQPDQGPMNNIPELIEKANYPKQAIIAIGATRYTDFGEHHFLQVGDTSIVVFIMHKNILIPILLLWQKKEISLRIFQLLCKQ